MRAKQGCHHGGQGHGHSACCCSEGRKMHGFMETCLLVLLRDRQDHGYSLAEQLGDFGFGDVNVSTLYRVMRRMENAGWVTSSWEEGGKGPQRRVYAITESGKAALTEQIAMFEQRRTCIETLLRVYADRTEK